MSDNKKQELKTIVLGGGCFWCLEEVFSHTRGVLSAMPGYAGGSTENPTYEEIHSGKTGHAEVVKVDFDPAIIPFDDILRIFFSLHDPTTPNRQGNDVGPEYRSLILYADTSQKDMAEKIINDLAQQKIFSGKIVTELEPLQKFWEAEEYHQKYYEKNPGASYCQVIVAPKLAKFRKMYRKYYE